MKPKIFLIIGLVMFLIMVVFLFYAANHPEVGTPFSLSLGVTHMIYKLYVVIMALSFVVAIVLKVMNKVKK